MIRLVFRVKQLDLECQEGAGKHQRGRGGEQRPAHVSKETLRHRESMERTEQVLYGGSKYERVISKATHTTLCLSRRILRS